MKKETMARLLILVLVFGATLTPLIVRWVGSAEVVELHAAMPEKGGWLTPNLVARVGEPLHLRLVSDDVVHGFAVGQSEIAPVDVLPGKPSDVTLTFDEPGTYTFYCTRWCGADHWRMRGTITVEGEGIYHGVDSPDAPLYLQLGIDLDDPHDAKTLPVKKPNAVRGASFAARYPDSQFIDYRSLDYYRTHSPAQTWSELRSDTGIAELDDDQVWDLVAWIWQQAIMPENISKGQALYDRDCVACHGVTGTGYGIFGAKAATVINDHSETEFNQPVGTPADFTDSASIYGASPALLQGKILRGGMGTGMPSWGLIYTKEQTWALTDYLWQFSFQYLKE